MLSEFARALDRRAVTGEAGIGKTRGLEELARLARARGVSVWRAVAYDGAGAPAYRPWVEILRRPQRTH